MGTETTFAGLIANPRSEKVFLAELKLGQLLQGWDKTTVAKLTAITCSIANPSGGPSFITNSSEDLSSYAGYYGRLVDSAGKSFIFTIDAAGTGQTYSVLTPTSCCTDPDDDQDNTTGWTALYTGTLSSVANDSGGKCMFQQKGAVAGGASGGTGGAIGMLMLWSADIKGAGSHNDLFIGGVAMTRYAGTGSFVTHPEAGYITATDNFVAISNVWTADSYIDNWYVKKVLTPSATGVTLTQISVESGFDYKSATFDLYVSETINGLSYDATSTYEKAYLNETITLADSKTETIRKVIAAMEEDGSAYTSRASVALVDANASSFYHDTTNGILYAHASDGGTPDDFTMIGYFWLYFATQAINLNSMFYEPYIAERGIPKISQSTPDIHWGISKIGSGAIVFNNGRGYFDQIARNFIWHNKQAKILLGGDSLAYSEYATLFTGRIVDTNFSKREFSVDLRSNSFDLLRTLPINDFWASTYANLDPSAEGRPIPYYYGSYSAAQAPLVTCINTAYAGNTYQFKICDTTAHEIKSITQVYVDYGDGAGWQTIVHANEDLAAATFTINTASFVVGTSRVKVAFEGYHVASVLIEGAPEIAEDILTNLCGYAAADLNAASFTASKALSDVTLNVPIEAVTSALTIIETICKSDLAFFDEDGDGLLRYRTWEPSATGTIPVIDYMDILEDQVPSVKDDTSRLFWKVKVGYGYLCNQGEHLYVEESTAASKYKYAKNEVLTHETYLRTSAQATTLAARINWVTRDPSPTLNVLLKAVQINKLLGDKIKVTLARAPYGTAGGFDERIFELIGKDFSCFPVKMTLTGRDIMDFGNNVGFWMADTAPAWAAATAQERDDSGFWCDANGYAVAGDETSKNKSLWW